MSLLLQGIIDNEGISDTSQEAHNNRESPSSITTTSTTTAHQYQNSGQFERNTYSRHNSGAAAASYNQQQQESPYSPQHNNNLTGTFTGRGDTNTREGQSLPPLLRVGDKLAAAHVSQIVKGERDGDVGDDEQQRSAQHLSANCVIFTYYTGDISKLVDEHFTKALSQSSDRGNNKEDVMLR